MKKKFDKEVALQVFKDGGSLTVAEKNMAVGYIYLWLDISSGDIIDVDRCFFAELKKVFDEVLGNLKEQEADVLIKRFALNGSEEVKTLKEIGEDYDVTQERIRQIEAKALKKLSHPRRKKSIQKLLDKTSYYEEKLAKKELELAKLKKEKEFLRKGIDINVTLAQMNLSEHSCNCLRRAGINTLEQLSQMTMEDFNKVRNLGKRSLKEVLNKLSEYGITIKKS